MGIHDRDYYRDDDDASGWRPKGPNQPRSIVFWLILANVALYLANMFFSKSDGLSDSMALQANLFEKPWQFWQLLTSGFAHAPLGQPAGLTHILLNMYALFMFGRDVERKYGRYEFLTLYLVTVILSGLAWVGMQVISGDITANARGASGAVTAVVILFCLNFPKRTLLLFGVTAVPAWSIGVMLIGLDLLRAFGDTNVAWEAHLAGALIGFLYFRLGFRFERLVPRKFRGGVRIKRRPKLKIHAPEDKNEELDKKADEILQKIHQEGEDNLTSKERRILEAYSRRIRQKRR